MTAAPSLSTPIDVAQKSLLHLHAAAQALLPLSTAVSSALFSQLLAGATENDITLPQSYLDTRVCQRCGILYIPGGTCIIRNVQSRRQKRKAKELTWLVYECNVCHATYRAEAVVPRTTPQVIEQAPALLKSISPENAAISKVEKGRTGKARKRDRLQGLKTAVEKSKTERASQGFSLQDLMKVD